MYTKKTINAWGAWILTILVALITSSATPKAVFAASASEINAKVNTALARLYKTEPGSKTLADKARGVLVFPDIVKGGFIVAGQYGDGALRKGGRTVAYYRSLAASVGFQAGAHSGGCLALADRQIGLHVGRRWSRWRAHDPVEHPGATKYWRGAVAVRSS